MTIRPDRIDGLPDDIEIRRSTRRTRYVAARREGERTVVTVPERMSASEAAKHALALHKRIVAKVARAQDAATSDELLRGRAAALSQRYLPGAPMPTTIGWSDRQNRLWGSCTSARGTIRLSSRLQRMPDYVIDYVTLHELAHLLEANHGPRFQALMAAYPARERAQAFLNGVDFARANLLEPDTQDPDFADAQFAEPPVAEPPVAGESNSEEAQDSLW